MYNMEPSSAGWESVYVAVGGAAPSWEGRYVPATRGQRGRNKVVSGGNNEDNEHFEETTRSITGTTRLTPLRTHTQDATTRLRRGPRGERGPHAGGPQRAGGPVPRFIGAPPMMEPGAQGGMGSEHRKYNESHLR